MAGKFDLDVTTLGTLLDDPEARAVIDDIVPELPEHPMIGFAKGMPANAVFKLAAGQIDPAITTQLRERLEAL